MARRTVNTAGRPRKTTLVGHSGTPGQKVAAKPSVLVTGSRGSTGSK